MRFAPLMLAVVALAAASVPARTQDARNKIGSILSACRANPTDKVFRAEIDCAGVEEDPAAAAEDLAIMQPEICKAMDGECRGGARQSQANNVASAIGCTTELSPSCRVAAGRPYDLCGGKLRVEYLNLNPSVMMMAIATSSGQTAEAVFNTDIDPASDPVKRWMKQTAQPGGAPSPAFSAKVRGYVGTHCDNFNTADTEALKAAITQMILWFGHPYTNCISKALGCPEPHQGTATGVRG